MDVTNDKTAVQAIVEYYNEKKDRSELESVLEYIRKYKMKRTNSHTKGFLNCCILTCLCDDKNQIDDKITGEWVTAWKKCGEMAYNYAFNSLKKSKMPGKISDINKDHVKYANSICLNKVPNTFPKEIVDNKKTIVDRLIQIVGRELKTGFPYKCAKAIDKKRKADEKKKKKGELDTLEGKLLPDWD